MLDLDDTIEVEIREDDIKMDTSVRAELVVERQQGFFDLVCTDGLTWNCGAVYCWSDSVEPDRNKRFRLSCINLDKRKSSQADSLKGR